MLPRIVCSCAVGAFCPPSQSDETRTARNPARRRSAMFAFAVTSSGERTASSLAPSVIDGPPARAPAAATRQAATPTASALLTVDTLATMIDGLREQLRSLPTKPGVYLFRGERD